MWEHSESMQANKEYSRNEQQRAEPNEREREREWERGNKKVCDMEALRHFI